MFACCFIICYLFAVPFPPVSPPSTQLAVPYRQPKYTWLLSFLPSSVLASLSLMANLGLLEDFAMSNIK